MNYYNEYDHNAAEWIRQLIALGCIPKGDVDERSITDVQPSDLRRYTQCHFFAGIAGWSEALRRAGVDADRPLWTGSCPCQAFSCAGKQQGVEDPRDLWPHFFRLIRECRPERIFGEQVEAAVGHGWLDRLSADMEQEGYAVGSCVLGAHSSGADHIRQRLYWFGRLGYSTGKRLSERSGIKMARKTPRCFVERSSDDVIRMENTPHIGRGGRGDGDQAGMRRTLQTAGSGGSCRMGEPILPGLQRHTGDVADRNEPGRVGTFATGSVAETNRARNFWSDAEPIWCRDGKYRRAEPGIFPLVAKLPRGVGYGGDPSLPSYANNTAEARVMRLKGYGNAINVETAKLFIEACEDILK